MSDKLSTPATTIENLPSELFRELFEFFSTIELFRTFFGINSKIDEFLSQLPNLALTIVDEDDLKFLIKGVLPLFRPCTVKQLKLDASLSIRNTTVEQFFVVCPLSAYTELRSLVIFSLNRPQYIHSSFLTLVQEASKLKHLQSLKLRAPFRSSHVHVENIECLCDMIFKHHECFPSLTRYVLDFPFCEILFTPILSQSKITRIEHLQLPTLDLVDFLRLFYSHPHVKSIVTGCLNYDPEKEVLSRSIVLLSCVDLNMEFEHPFGIEEMEFLMSHFPNLQRLKVAYSHHFNLINMSDGKRWERILSQYCSKLKRFELILYDCDGLINFTDQYWQERGVLIDTDRYGDSTVQFGT